MRRHRVAFGPAEGLRRREAGPVRGDVYIYLYFIKLGGEFSLPWGYLLIFSLQLFAFPQWVLRSCRRPGAFFRTLLPQLGQHFFDIGHRREIFPQHLLAIRNIVSTFVIVWKHFRSSYHCLALVSRRFKLPQNSTNFNFKLQQILTNGNKFQQIPTNCNKLKFFSAGQIATKFHKFQF